MPRKISQNVDGMRVKSVGGLFAKNIEEFCLLAFLPFQFADIFVLHLLNSAFFLH